MTESVIESYGSRNERPLERIKAGVEFNICAFFAKITAAILNSLKDFCKVYIPTPVEILLI